MEYSSDLWWRFAFRGDAPRFLRGLAGASAVVAIAGLIRLLRRVPTAVGLAPDEDALNRAKAVIARSPDPAANLALLGDKRLLFSASAAAGSDTDGFVMYAEQGGSWITMGGPVGPPETREELAWAFRTAAEKAEKRAVLYGVPESDLALLIDLGMTPYKLGEHGVIPLGTFSLDGGSRRGLRKTIRRVDEAGYTLEVLPSESVPEMIPELQRISEAWMDGKAVAEKGFSLGFFNPAYLQNFPVAVVRQVVDAPVISPDAQGASSEGAAGKGQIVAFANMWVNDRLSGDAAPGAASKTEASIDLMRFDRERAPDGVMDYLITKVILWAQQEGYGRFSLGMAPLSGLEPDGDASLAPLWNRAGHLLFRHGEHFYNFQGLRNYKEKFDPVWKPRYLAVPRGRLDLAGALMDVATLISGGLGELIRK
ncbi:MAG: phosphatidylglycerol lysyltransferase [Rhodothermales bacterium]